jgi:hypothetical protein
MTWIYLFRKYAVWLSLNAYLLLTTTWLSAMRIGLIIPACMQPVSHSMNIKLNLAFSSWTPIFTTTLIVFMWLSFTAMNIDIKYGARAWRTMHERLITTKGCIWLPLLAAACWFLFREELPTLLSLLSWLCFIGFLASCSLLLMKTRKA